MLATTAKKTSFTPKLLVPVGIFIVFLLLSFAMENLLSTENYFWGKIFVIDPTTEMPYESPLLWLNVMFKIYGYSLSIGSLLLAIRHKKMRLVTLFIHVLVIMIVGWQMTSHFAV